MSLTKTSINNPYGVIALALVVVALGLFAFFRTPTDLFPDTAPPQVAVITVEPGAASGDIADKITQIIEKEINTISGLKRIRSTSRDEVSAVTAEFYYTKKIGEAVTDVQNAVARIRAQLPADVMEPRIYRITDATRALMTISLSPKKGSAKNLSTIRLLAENQIMDDFLRVPGIGDVDVFGANEPEVQVTVNRDKLAAYNINLNQVLGAISKQNVTAPAGTVYTKAGEYLVKIQGEFSNLDDLRTLPLKRTYTGSVLLRDVAKIELSTHEARSGYIGNGKEAIAINVMRPEGGKTVWAIKNAKKELNKLRKRYPDIDFQITNDQQPIIDTNVKGMRSSVVQAVLLTIFIILIFLADTRAAMAISLSIPMAFLTALVVLWFSPYTLNMVTLSGVIIAVGMVVDASIVVLEIIYRKHKEKPDVPIKDVTLEGADEIFHGVAAGVFTTVIVLVPVMFAGGYTQQVMRPLNMMITATILSSLVAAFTIIPLAAIKLLSKPEPAYAKFITKMLTPFTRWMERRTEGVASFAAFLLKHRQIALIMAIPFIGFSMRVVRPLNGQELMPPMDTGVGIIKFDTPTHYTPEQVLKVSKQVENMIRKNCEGLKWISTTIGSEPGEISFGGGGATAQSVNMLITLVDRKHRKSTIWDMEKKWRAGLRAIDGVRTFDVTEYGATPLSTTKAPLDIVISGPNIHVLDKLADQFIKSIKSVKGVTDVRRSWYIDKVEQNVIVNPELAKFYGLNPADIAKGMKVAIKGVPVSSMRLESALDIPIVAKYETPQMNKLSDLQDILVPTKRGIVPLRAMASITTHKNAPFITRENLANTIDITGINSGMTIKQVGKQVKAIMKGFKVPEDYKIYVSGTLADMKQGGMEMGHALLIGIVLLYILLVWMYKSFIHPFTIMLSIIIPVAAAMWGLMIFHKPMCKPAMMGLILLAGTVVNNAILILDFILTARAQGMPKDEAIIQAVRLRFRPIVMTAASTAIGLTPLVFEFAVGMERMSPLGIVASVGLIVGIFASCWIYPVIYSLVDSATEKIKGQSPKAVAAIILICIFGMTGNLYAQVKTDNADNPAIQTATDITMALQDAIAYAQTNSPLLHIAQAETDMALGNEKSVRAGLLPQIDIIGNSYYSDKIHPVIPGLSPSEVQFSDTTVSLGVSIRQLLWDFGQTWNRMDAARMQSFAAEKSLERKEDEITFKITALYHQRIMLDDLLKATAATQKSLQVLVDNIQKRLDVGKASILDLHKAKVKLIETQSRMALLDAQKENAQSSLLAAMGYHGPDIHWQKVNIEDLATNEQIDTNISIEQAMTNRTDLQAVQALVAATANEEESARRSRWPVFSAFGQYAQYDGSDPEPGKMPGGNESDGWDDNYTIGVQLSFPIFDSGLRSGKIAAAHAKQVKAEAQQENLRLNIKKEIRTAIAGLKSAQYRVKANKESLDEAILALADEQKKYDVGKSTINDLLDAEASKLFADSRYSQALHEEKIAIVNLKLATGERLKEKG